MTGARMTPAERRRWWQLHGTTIEGTDDDKFAMDLARRGLIRLNDGMANANYWVFTEDGARACFGDEG